MDLIQLTGAWDRGYAIHTYNNPDGGRTLLGEVIYRYQYRKQWDLVDSLARWAQTAIQANGEFKGVDLLVPVPTSRSLSDYDPTSLLVDWISQLTTIPRAQVLARYGLIYEYSGSYAESDGMRGGFTVTMPEAVRGRKILLIDGIICSGSTLHLATQALLDAGAASVSALVFTKIERSWIDSHESTVSDREV